MKKTCPNCDGPLTANQLRVYPLICPHCETKLQVHLKANWAYTVLSLAIASLVACLKGYQSIDFIFWTVMYAAAVIFLIKYYRWELHLPIELVVVPDLRILR